MIQSMMIFLMQGILLALPATLTPSPFKMYIISEALQNGFRRALPAVLAPAITDGPIILLVLLILSRTPQWMLDVLRLGGGVYLLYLTTNMVRLLRQTVGPTLRAAAVPSGRQSLGRAVVINLLNPNAYIFWAVVAGPILVAGLQQSLAAGLAFVFGFYAVFFVGVILVLWVFATAGRINAAVNRALLGLSAVGMAAIGIMQIWGGLRALAGV